MMGARRNFAGLTLALVLAGCNANSERDPGQWPISRDDLERNTATSDPAEGTYRRYCVGCHGADGRGNGGVTGADFTRTDGPFSQKTNADLALSVRNGRRGAVATMPAHAPVLKDAQIAAVVAYVRQRYAGGVQEPSAPTEPQAAPATP